MSDTSVMSITTTLFFPSFLLIDGRRPHVLHVYCDYRLCSRGVTVCYRVLLLRLWVSLHNFKVTVAFCIKACFKECVSASLCDGSWLKRRRKKKEAHCDLRAPFWMWIWEIHSSAISILSTFWVRELTYLAVNGSAYQDVQKHLRYLLNNKLIRGLTCINKWSMKSCGLTPTTAARLFYSPAASVSTMTSYLRLISR